MKYANIGPLNVKIKDLLFLLIIIQWKEYYNYTMYKLIIIQWKEF